MSSHAFAIDQHLQACRLEGRQVFLPDYQIPPDAFPKVKRAIEGIGGKWTFKAQAFVFKNDPESLFERICRGESIDLARAKRKKTQFFETTPIVLEEIEQRISIGRGTRVLEPSAGRAAIARFLKKTFSGFEWQLDCCELDPENRGYLEQEGFRPVGDDFLAMPKPERGYHLIVANPPFSGGQDVEHFNRMYELLAPGGRVICVMSTRWRSSNDAESVALRHFLGYFFHEVVELPAGAFRASGTMCSTCLLMLDKPLDEAY